MNFKVLCMTVAVLFSWYGLVYCDEWPDWRGLNRDGTWQETGVKKNFDSPQIKKKWRVPISSGYSGPTVADRRVYITDRVKKPKEIERVMCFDAMTGEKNGLIPIIVITESDIRPVRVLLSLSMVTGPIR